MKMTSQNSVYLSHFDLRKPPFTMTPDPKYFFQSRTHLEALASLVYGIKERKGFILLTGNVGTGKTTVLRTLLESIDTNVVFSHVINTDVTYTELLQMICSDFGLAIAGRGKVELTEDLFSFLVETRLEGKTALVVVDEAQNLRSEVMESLRMLSNLETPRDKLLQILLCGQPELQAKLQQGALRQLAQRIVVSCTLSPLEPREVERYIYQRMRISGGCGDEVFPEEVTEYIAELSGGVPRLINILCDTSLLLAYAEGGRVVTKDIVEQAAAQCIGLASIEMEPQIEPVSVARPGKAKSSLLRRLLPLFGRVAVIVAIILVIVAMGVFGFYGKDLKTPPKDSGVGREPIVHTTEAAGNDG